MLKKLIAYFKGVRGELQKVSWVSKSRFIRSFISIIISLVVATVVIMLIDTGLRQLLKLIISV